MANTNGMHKALEENKDILSLIGESNENLGEDKIRQIENTIVDLSEYAKTRIDEFQSCASFLMAYDYIQLGSNEDYANREAMSLYWALLRAGSDISTDGYRIFFHGNFG